MHIQGFCKASACDLIRRNASHDSGLLKRLLQDAFQTVITNSLIISAPSLAKANTYACFINNERVRFG
jgi:hypothetical protein